MSRLHWTVKRFQASTRGSSNPMQLRVFLHVVSIFEVKHSNFMDVMFARDLLDLPATKVLTQSKVRRFSMKKFWIFWVACNFCHYLRDMTRFISFKFVWKDSKSSFIVFLAISNLLYCIFKSRVLRLKHKWTWSRAEFFASN